MAHDKTSLLTESLMQALCILERALSFDFTAILLNETLDDPITTNIPSSWAPFVEQPATVRNLFRVLSAEIRNEQSTSIKIKAAQALQHLACVRHSIFESTDKRVAYVTNFVTEIVKFLQSPALQAYVMKERLLYKEFVPILLKVQNTFQVRDMSKAGDALLEGYLSVLFNFTIASYKVPSESINFHASKLNHLWQRVFFESMALNVSCQGRLD